MQTQSTHGTGCTFSAAIAGGLARGMEPQSAIALAKSYVTLALEYAYPVGARARAGAPLLPLLAAARAEVPRRRRPAKHGGSLMQLIWRRYARSGYAPPWFYS